MFEQYLKFVHEAQISSDEICQKYSNIKKDIFIQIRNIMFDEECYEPIKDILKMFVEYKKIDQEHQKELTDLKERLDKNLSKLISFRNQNFKAFLYLIEKLSVIEYIKTTYF